MVGEGGNLTEGSWERGCRYVGERGGERVEVEGRGGRG